MLRGITFVFSDQSDYLTASYSVEILKPKISIAANLPEKIYICRIYKLTLNTVIKSSLISN